jgi:hypothetical protein
VGRRHCTCRSIHWAYEFRIRDLPKHAIIQGRRVDRHDCGDPA